MQLTNTTAIVTGGASGLGAATAVALVKAGATVFALDLAQAINKAPGIKGVKYLPTDVTSGDQVRQAVQTLPARTPRCAQSSTAPESAHPPVSWAAREPMTSNSSQGLSKSIFAAPSTS